MQLFKMRTQHKEVFSLLLCLVLTSALDLNLSSIESIKSVSSTIAYDLMSLYNGNASGSTLGELPFPPYYWWESGGMWGCMLDYWMYTNDTTYNDLIQEGLLFQVGDDWDFMPENQTVGMGNDDQGFWGMTAMTATELNFQNPPANGPQWLGLAQAVFNEEAARWAVEVQDKVCGGGLRWQVYSWANGWTYKNSISTSIYFNLGARLARYTLNDTYAQLAESSWDWITKVGLMELQPYTNASKNFDINGQGAGGYITWDGTYATDNCSGVNGIPYTYNAAMWLLGAATMYNYTNGSEIWQNRTQLLLNGTLNAFFRNQIAVEVSCEPNLTCDTDQLSFKAYLLRTLAAITKLAAFTTTQVIPVLAASATAAALQCSGGANGRMCGLQWTKGAKWDGTQGAGQQMAAMEAVLSNLVVFGALNPPMTVETGGTSVGDPGAGTRPQIPVIVPQIPPTMANRIGADVLTVAVVSAMITLFIWMCTKEVDSINN